jgi:hypothetical protein
MNYSIASNARRNASSSNSAPTIDPMLALRLSSLIEQAPTKELRS